MDKIAKLSEVGELILLHQPFCLASYGDLGGSAFYRVVSPFLTTALHGHINIRFPNRMVFFGIDDLRKFKPDTLIFHRSHTYDQLKYVKSVTDAGINSLKIYCIDDWVEKVPKESIHYKNIGPHADRDIKKVINQCDRLIVSTDLLRAVYGNKIETFVIPNYLSDTVWKSVYTTSVRKGRMDSRPRIGWAGGGAHAGDLKILREIADILGDSVRWVFLGDIPKGFDDANSEIHMGVPVIAYPKALYELDLDLALAPLLNNDFNRAKSNLRILEYGACGYPVLASNVLTYKNTPVSLLEYKPEFWAHAIKAKLEDLDALKEEGKQLQDWVWQTHKLEDHLLEYATVASLDKNPFIPSKPEVSDIVDVIITTHNNREVVERCVNSVVESIPHNSTKVNVIVADDASNETGFKDYLIELRNKGITVIEKQSNVGYINNVNSACTINPNNDVIVLNSDTLTNGNWIDRLRKTAYSDEKISTATPWSNQATINSYPNPQGSELVPVNVKFYDNIAKTLDFSEQLRLPTPIGFCSFIKRKCLAEIGMFDSNAFGRGYGEENDWGMKALMKGYLHVLAPNVYVGHAGNGTFGPEKQSLMEKAAHVIITRWPQYGQLVEQWMKADPLKSYRQQLDIACIEKTTIRPRILYISHGYGGGLETYVQSQIAKDNNAIILRNDPSHLGTIRMELPDDTYYNLPIIDTRYSVMPYLADTFTRFNVNHVSVQTTFGYDYTMPQWIMNLTKLMNVKYSVMLHDYFTICPRLRLVQQVTYCGEPDIDGCNKCVTQFGSAVGQVDVGQWRSMYHEFLLNAEHVYAPSYDLANRIRSYFRDIEVNVIPHESSIEIGQYQGSLEYKGVNKIRVAIIGSLSPDKGSLIVRDCAKYCKENDLPVEFVVFGNLMENSAVLKPVESLDNVQVLGIYKDENLQQLVEQNKCHISFFPGQWPETWSYTLSHAIRAGLYPVCYNIGAIAERIKISGYGHIMPFNYSLDIPRTVETLLEVVKTLNYRFKDDVKEQDAVRF